MKLTVDANGNDAFSEDFDPDNIVQFGGGIQWTDFRGRATIFGAGAFFDVDGNAVVPDHWRDAAKYYQQAMWEDYWYPNGVYGGSTVLGEGNWFESGNMAMAHVHLWYASCCMGGLESTWNTAAVPSYDGTHTAKMHADTFAIVKASDHPAEAFEVLTYLLGDAANDLAKIYGGLPARQSLQGTYFDEFGSQFFPGQDINWDVVVAGMSYPDNPNHEEGMPNELEARDALNEWTQLLDNDPELDVDASLDALQATLQGIFDAADN
jgi:multiple sugar transport system substrate-binding protein